jgi:hypothetical protein
MRKSLWIFVFSVLVLGFGSGNALAQTPDEQPPSQETVCDNESGAAYGLCNAYCEAMDCDDPNVRASDAGCEAVRRNFERKTGRPMPCMMTCPCAVLLQLFADINSGAAKVTACFVDDNLITVTVEGGEQAVISNGPPGTCSVNGEPPFVELTAAERLVCSVALRKAVEAQGVPCRRPE